MSRVGKNPVAMPAGVTATLEGLELKVKGKLGELSLPLRNEVLVKVADGKVSVAPNGTSKFARAMWGTTRANIANMIKGVSSGFVKKLEIAGIGYKAAAQGNVLKLNLGYSHDINFTVPEGIKVVTPSPTTIEVSGINRELVGETAAKIRGYRGPEPYKGKGVHYEGEYIVRKQGKKK
jgi:large subunit ribosomal protein L6